MMLESPLALEALDSVLCFLPGCTKARVVGGSSRIKSSQAISMFAISPSSPWRSSSVPRSCARCHKASRSERFLFSVFSWYSHTCTRMHRSTETCIAPQMKNWGGVFRK